MHAHLMESSISHFKNSDSLLHTWCVLILCYSKDINDFTLIIIYNIYILQVERLDTPSHSRHPQHSKCTHARNILFNL